jgi:hypothetical protein
VFTPSAAAFFDALTLQLAKPQYDGSTFDVETFIGSVVKSIEFKMDNKGVLTMNIEWDAQTMSTVIAKASPSAVVANRFTFAGFAFATGAITEPTTVALGVGATPLDGIKSFSVKIENEMDVEDFRGNGSGKKAQPTVSRQVITWQVEADYIAAIAALKANWIANSTIPMVATFTTGTDAIQFIIPAGRISDPVKSNADGSQPKTTLSGDARKTAASTQAFWIVTRTADATL